MIEIVLVALLVIFLISYRRRSGNSIYEFFSKTVGTTYEKYAPFSFKLVREKTKELGKEYTPKQYLLQVILFAGFAGVVSYLYFYSIIIAIMYAVIAIMFIPYLAFLRCKKVYNEFVFEQVQVYTTNVIMEFNTTKSFVKALEGVRDSGVLEDPMLSDIREMIDISYEKGNIEESINYMNSKYDYYVMRNMHQLFLQITKEGSKDSGEALENMSQDIDMLVESVYRDRLDRENFHKQFLTFGLSLYLLIMLIQYLLGAPAYVKLIELWYVQILLHLVILVNSFFLLNGEKYYYENVGAE
ncbi:MAG: hypothetical protein RR228_03865 [Bacilli bacterium]